MNRILMAAALLGALAATPAHAQTYWRAGGGLSKPMGVAMKDRDFQTGMGICTDVFCSAPDQVDNVSTSLIFEGGAGYRFTPNLRGELMLSHRDTYSLRDADGSGALYSTDIKSTALMLNGYYDFAASGDFKPYVGMGLGWAHNRMNTFVQGFALANFVNTLPHGSKNNRAFALMAGVSIPQQGWTLDIGYRYIDLGSIQSGNFYFSTAFPGFVGFPVSGVAGRLRAHELTVGTRF